MRPKQIIPGLLAVSLLCGMVAIYVANRPPRGEAELKIWEEIQADERISGPDKLPVTLVSWSRGRHFGDLSPTDTIVVSTERGRLRVSASAYCLVPDGWKASIGTVVPIDK